MFKSISKTLLTGFITVLPVLLTIYLIFWMIGSSEQMMSRALKWILPGIHYFPGLGVIAAVVVLFIVGLLMKAYMVRQLFAFSEELLLKLPLIKSIYRALKDFFDFLSPKDNKPGQVVAVSHNGMEMIGLVTQEDQQRLPEAFQGEDKVLVYFPLSYIIGGFTMFVPRDKVRPLKMGKDEAIRFVMTAGITGKRAE